MVLKTIAGRGCRHHRPSEKDKIQETSAKNQRGYSLAFYFAYIISTVLDDILESYIFFLISSSCSLAFDLSV